MVLFLRAFGPAMHQRESIEDGLRRYLRDEVGVTVAVADDDRLIERGFVASARLLDLVGFIEDEFKIELRPRDVIPDNLASIATMASMIRRRLEEA